MRLTRALKCTSGALGSLPGCINVQGWHLEFIRLPTAFPSLLSTPPTPTTFPSPALLLHHDECCPSVGGSSQHYPTLKLLIRGSFSPFLAGQYSAVLSFNRPGQLFTRDFKIHSGLPLCHPQAPTFVISAFLSALEKKNRCYIDKLYLHCDTFTTPRPAPRGRTRTNPNSHDDLTIRKTQYGIQLRPSSSRTSTRTRRYRLSSISTVPEWRWPWWTWWQRRQRRSQSSSVRR